MVSGIPTASGYEERIRFAEMEIVDRQANEKGLTMNAPSGHFINGWDINVAGVRTTSVKKHVRYHTHAVSYIIQDGEKLLIQLRRNISLESNRARIRSSTLAAVTMTLSSCISAYGLSFQAKCSLHYPGRTKRTQSSPQMLMTMTRALPHQFQHKSLHRTLTKTAEVEVFAAIFGVVETRGTAHRPPWECQTHQEHLGSGWCTSNPGDCIGRSNVCHFERFFGIFYKMKELRSQMP